MKDKSKKTQAAPATLAPPRGRFWRYCFVLILVGLAALAWASLLTFDKNDPPSKTVSPPLTTIHNAAGVTGAYVAYGLRFWLGGGAYMGLLFLTIAASLMIFGARITELPWRILGVALLVAATSAAVYLSDPVAGEDVDRGVAGILGIACGRFLHEHLAATGAWLVVIITLLMGLMLAADNLVLRLPRLGRKVWDRRGEIPNIIQALRPTPQPALADARSVTASPRAAAAAPASTVAERPAPRLAPKAKPDNKPPVALHPKPADVPSLAPRPKLAEAPAQALKPAPVKPPGPPKLAPERAKPAAEKPKEKDTEAPASGKQYTLPSAELLASPTGGYLESQEAQAEVKRQVLQQTLNDFNVAAEVIGYMTGPVITLFELTVAPGVKVAQIANLANDIARALAVPGVRVVSPIPGKDTIGIEVPNLNKEIVRIRELMDMAPEADEKMFLPLYLGKDAGGGAIVADLASMPHLLIAGTTGSGKSVCINAVIMAMLMKRMPEQVRLILVDPKMVEMAAFEKIPHLLCPIVNDMHKAEEILEWAAMKMDERYELLKEAGVKNIAGFNRLKPEEIYQRFAAESEEDRKGIPTKLPYYVIIVDELADLIMTSTKDVENHIIRIAQKARAVGIHLILATQRPSVNVVTGLIKSNMPCRVSFRVASRQESRIVLDQNGADVLLGGGDMLFLQPGSSSLVRAQGTYVDDGEIRTVVSELRNRSGEPQYNAELIRLQSSAAPGEPGEKDELFNKAVEVVLQSQRGSVSLLQRRLAIGYSRSSRIIDQMADAGILGDYKGSQARECLMTLEDWQAMKASIEADQSGESAANGEPTSS